ncbi:metal ion transporter, metal ion family protein [Burkholderia thailandensis MSMB121]|uniref:Nramp family divalent metal transporter n=1 Tax=Burkholderia humptydooensis TaxID=430531 RepID=UPI000327ED57|nr:Nramp family divalent metal transporter [Burkholderia humptydooensis]AGK46046.1 metal ion transporter, metal ion family protein [Burkholderia thailandensis MSMB121]ATF36833.1 divalent metal cation transporter MntH [Burkholderia thailandensis]KST74206.1 manganese transporter [Burkholderia humptydooensis]
MNSRPLAARCTPPRRPSASGGPGGGRRWAAFVGAGVLVAVGYMDPGNWATALAGGAGYGYALLGIVIAASLMAMLLQWLAARIGVVSGRDLAQLCRERFDPRVTVLLWIAAEIAIIACDVAEVVGAAVALQMLFGVSLTAGVLVSAVGTLAMLALERRGRRTLEAAIASLIFFVGLCFVIEVALARPDWHAALAGAAPPRLLREPGMLWLSAGILGATVMPHNLYLHSMLVKHHASERDEQSIRRALFGVNLDTFVSLGFAFVINAALLIVAAAVFHASGHDDVTDLADAHRLIAPLVGNRWAGLLFAAALLACGLSATVTGTLAGQAIMEGFLKLTLPRWQRALLTRALAIGPALAAVGLFGQHGSNQLLVASQVVLSLQLPLAMVPLVVFASSRALMGNWRVRGLPLAAAWVCAAVILLLNGALVWQVVAAE